MADLTNSHSLTEFQRNARSFIDGLNASKEPMLLTVNGKVQAVLVDPVSYQQLERQRFIAAIRESEIAVRNGQFQDLEAAFSSIRGEHTDAESIGAE